MVGMLSTLINKKPFDALLSLVQQSRSNCLLQRYIIYLVNCLVPQPHNILSHLSCPSTKYDSSLILSLNPQRLFAYPYVDSTPCSLIKDRLGICLVPPSRYD